LNLCVLKQIYLNKRISNYKHCPELCIIGHHVLQDAAADAFFFSSFLCKHCKGREGFASSVLLFLNFEIIVFLYGSRTDILSTLSKNLQLVLGA